MRNRTVLERRVSDLPLAARHACWRLARWRQTICCPLDRGSHSCESRRSSRARPQKSYEYRRFYSSPIASVRPKSTAWVAWPPSASCLRSSAAASLEALNLLLPDVHLQTSAVPPTTYGIQPWLQSFYGQSQSRSSRLLLAIASKVKDGRGVARR